MDNQAYLIRPKDLFKIIVIYILIFPVYSLNCNTYNFDNDSDFQYFKGDFVPIASDNLGGANNGSMKIIRPSSGHPIVTTSVIFDEDYGTVRFRWRKEEWGCEFSNLIFEIDGSRYVCIENPFFKRIDKKENRSQELRWILENDSRIHIGAPKSVAFIDELTLCGLHFSDEADGSSTSESPPIPISVPPFIAPASGGLREPYKYSISRENIPNCSEVFLWIKNPHTNGWHNFGKGKWDLNNITFQVPDLSFIEPPFLGDIEFKLTNNEDATIYKFTGPNININCQDNFADLISKTVSIEVITNLCERNICLYCHNKTYQEIYTGCGRWQILTFGPIPDLQRGDDYKVGVCDE